MPLLLESIFCSTLMLRHSPNSTMSMKASECPHAPNLYTCTNSSKTTGHRDLRMYMGVWVGVGERKQMGAWALHRGL